MVWRKAFDFEQQVRWLDVSVDNRVVGIVKVNQSVAEVQRNGKYLVWRQLYFLLVNKLVHVSALDQVRYDAWVLIDADTLEHDCFV